MKAALILINLDDGHTLSRTFTGDNPLQQAVAELRELRRDYPEHRSALVADSGARLVYNISLMNAVSERDSVVTDPSSPRGP